MSHKNEDLFNDIACILRAIARGQRVEHQFAAIVFEGFADYRRQERERESCICHELKRLNAFFRAPKSISIKQEDSQMGQAEITGIKVGGPAGTFDGSPQPAGTSFSGVVPVWTSSDPSNTALTPNPSLNSDGSSSVNVQAAPGAPVGGTFTLTATWTATDGSGATATGSVSVPYLAGTAPSNNPTSIDITQTA